MANEPTSECVGGVKTSKRPPTTGPGGRENLQSGCPSTTIGSITNPRLS
jgi:hypothetical protein